MLGEGFELTEPPQLVKARRAERTAFSTNDFPTLLCSRDLVAKPFPRLFQRQKLARKGLVEHVSSTNTTGSVRADHGRIGNVNDIGLRLPKGGQALSAQVFSSFRLRRRSPSLG